jgi:HAD superfamily hydrolase (TIGR01509 family)
MALLQKIGQELGLRIGIISTIGAFTNDVVWSMLENAGLTDHIDRTGFVSEHDAGVAKPHPEIYRFAANQFGLTTDRCLFIGENLAEIVGAKMAGMQAMIKPHL